MSGPVTGSAAGSAGEQPPHLRIVKGDPSPEELAALVAVVSGLATARSGVAPKPRSEWSAHHRKLRPPHAAGPGGWRSTSLPR